MLEFIRGLQQQPSGNLIAYCRVIGKNPLQVDGDFIAIHVVVSTLSAAQSSFPVVVFPPVAYETAQELADALSARKHCDIIRLEDFQIPQSKSDQDYINERLEDFNGIVRQYVEMMQQGFDKNPPVPDQSLTSAGLFPEGLSESALPVIRATATAEKEGPDLLNDLDNLVKQRADLPDFEPVLMAVRENHPEYDIDSFPNMIRLNRFHLLDLYVKKFFAISEERYETAADLQNQISVIESAYSR